jgi:hypothetical protein
MDVHVPQARDQEFPGAIHNDETALPASGETCADGINATVADNDITLRNDPVVHHIDYRDIPDEEFSGYTGTRHLGQRPVQQCHQHDHKRDRQPGDDCQQFLDQAGPRVERAPFMTSFHQCETQE